MHLEVLGNSTRCDIARFGTSAQTESDALCYQVERTRRILWSVIPPLLLAIGLIGNVLIIIVFAQKRLRRRKPVLCFTLITLAIFDILTHFFGLTMHWLRKALYAGEFDIQSLSSFVCKMHEFFVYCTLTYSTWILVVISVERFLVFFFRIRAGHFLRLNRMVGGFVMLGALCIGLHLHFFWTRSLIVETMPNGRVTYECTYINTSTFFMKKIQPKLDVTFSSIIPCVLLVVFNGCTVVRMFTRRRIHLLDNILKQRSHHRQRMAVTKMLVTVIAFFIVCTLPAKIYIMIYPAKAPPGIVKPSYVYYQYRLAWTVVLLLQYTNNCVNFYIYCVASRYFRRDIRETLCGGEAYDQHPSNDRIVNHGIRGNSDCMLSRDLRNSPAEFVNIPIHNLDKLTP